MVQLEPQLMWPLYKPIEDEDYKYELLEPFVVRLPNCPLYKDVSLVQSHGNTNFYISLKREFSNDVGYFGDKLDCRLYVAEGFRWDGPSGPTVDNPSWMRGPLVHDILSLLGRAGLLSAKARKWADRMMLEILLTDNIYTHKPSNWRESLKKSAHNVWARARAYSWYYGVRLFARSSFKKNVKRW